MFNRIKKLFQKKHKTQSHFVVSGPIPEFGKIEPTSATWVFVEAWAKAEIDLLRGKNDSLGISEQQTTVYRAQIKLLKKILALPHADKKTNDYRYDP